MAQWVEYSLMVQETRVQSQGESYQRLKRLYLMLPCLTQHVSKVKWSNPGNGVIPFPTPRCRSYWKGCLRVTVDYGHQLYLLTHIYGLAMCALCFNDMERQSPSLKLETKSLFCSMNRDKSHILIVQRT